MLQRQVHRSTSGKGVDIFGKLKYINETDNRLNDARFLPYQPGDCPGGGLACAGNQNFYSPGNSTVRPLLQPAGHHGRTQRASTGYQWKPFDSLSDDDRDLKYYDADSSAPATSCTDDLYGIARPTSTTTST